MPPAIVIIPHAGRVRVLLGGQAVAETTRALSLTEGSRAPVLYIPRQDAAMAQFHPGALRTTCPWKGEASYFTIEAGGRRAENAAWSYEAPLPGVAAIAGHLAFYPDRVDAIEDS
jgi:uncharacterized protein (DUF427 family)